jgi:hypothetical protein
MYIYILKRFLLTVKCLWSEEIEHDVLLCINAYYTHPYSYMSSYVYIYIYIYIHNIFLYIDLHIYIGNQRNSSEFSRRSMVWGDWAWSARSTKTTWYIYIDMYIWIHMYRDIHTYIHVYLCIYFNKCLFIYMVWGDWAWSARSTKTTWYINIYIYMDTYI